MRIQSFGRVALASVAFMLTTAVQTSQAEQPATTLATLLDKQQINDMLVDYYGGLGGGRHDFGAYYIAEGVLDVNGIVAKGQTEIEGLYKKIADSSPHRPGAFRMLLTNLKINVNGEAATADVIWTGINSESAKAVPQFIEQGREHDELVKRNGKWLFKLRVITSDGGLPPMFEKTYKKR